MQTFYDLVEMFSCRQTALYGLVVVSVQIYSFKYISAEEVLNIQRVTINIADTNDNKPYFKNEFYQAGSVLSSFCLPSGVYPRHLNFLVISRTSYRPNLLYFLSFQGVSD